MYCFGTAALVPARYRVSHPWRDDASQPDFEAAVIMANPLSVQAPEYNGVNNKASDWLTWLLSPLYYHICESIPAI
jgi:hypothetical protein